MKYYCVYVKTGLEESFKEEAQKKVRLLDGGSEFYFFQSVLWLGKASRGQTEEKFAIKSYVFFKVAEFTAEIALLIKQTKGFMRFLISNDNVTQVKGGDYDILEKLLKYGRVLPMSKAEYTVGNKIKVLSGPLKDLEGNVCRVDRRTQRVQVFLPLFGGNAKVELSYDIITKKS